MDSIKEILISCQEDIRLRVDAIIEAETNSSPVETLVKRQGETRKLQIRFDLSKPFEETIIKGSDLAELIRSIVVQYRLTQIRLFNVHVRGNIHLVASALSHCEHLTIFVSTPWMHVKELVKACRGVATHSRRQEMSSMQMITGLLQHKNVLRCIFIHDGNMSEGYTQEECNEATREFLRACGRSTNLEHLEIFGSTRHIGIPTPHCELLAGLIQKKASSLTSLVHIILLGPTWNALLSA